MPAHLAHLPYDELQFTLVDCPGHASLIKTILGGMQLMDMIVLVVDTKGMVLRMGSFSPHIHLKLLFSHQTCTMHRV